MNPPPKGTGRPAVEESLPFSQACDDRIYYHLTGDKSPQVFIRSRKKMQKDLLVNRTLRNSNK